MHLPTITAFQSPEESSYFDFFRIVCTQDFSAYFNSNLWKGLILQAAHTEPFVFHAVLAIGSLRRTCHHAPIYPVSIIEYSLKKYNLASRLLSERIKNGTAGWKLAILGSLLFIAVEVLLANEMGALIHLRSGEAILRNLPSSNSKFTDRAADTYLEHVSSFSTVDGDSEDLVTAYTRLSVEEYPFLGLCGTTSRHVTYLSKKFNTMLDARTSLNSIVAATHSFYRRHGALDLKTLPFQPLPDKVALELWDLQEVLQVWHRQTEAFLSMQNMNEAAMSLGSKALIVQYLVAWIKLSTYFFESQIAYDEYFSQFEEIVSLTSYAVVADHSAYLKSLGRDPCYTLDITLAQPLYFVACKCRDAQLRRQAIRMMKLVGKEGIYTGRTVAKVAEWVVGNEENGHPTRELVVEGNRFYNVSFEFDIMTKTGRVWASRKSVHGQWEQVNETLDLS